MLLSSLDFPLTCQMLQKSLFTVCVGSSKYKWYIRLALHFFRAKCDPKDENHFFVKDKKAVLPPSTPLLHQKKSVTKFGSIYVEECS